MKILYLNNYLTEEIVHKRGLRARNAAGSNRVMRLSQALVAADCHVTILSTAISMRIHFKKWFHSKCETNENGIDTIFAAAVGVPYLSVVMELIIFLMALINQQKRLRPDAVMIYNFSPVFALAAVYLKAFTRCRLVLNMEDVSEPRLSDWNPRNEVRAFQQIILWICMKLIICLSCAAVIPTERFKRFLPGDLPVVTVTGCMDIPRISDHAVGYSPRILFAGKIEFVHGVNVLMDALLHLDQDDANFSHFEIDICGIGSKAVWIDKQLKKLSRLTLRSHGFVSDEKYRNLLNQADICLVLQNPSGRYAKYKTPSKAYEYLGNGKCVISSDSGDLGDLPDNVIIICNPFNAIKLVDIISHLIQRENRIESYKFNAFCFAKQNFDLKINGMKMKSVIKRLDSE